MILCIDCGNTSIKLGVYDESALVNKFTIKTNREKTSDEYAYSFKTLIKERYEIDGCIISSVVPLLTVELTRCIERVFKIKPLILNKSLKTKMSIKLDNPSELGADLLAGAIGARKKYGYPLVVADLGTATKLYVVDDKGAFVGGIISCGMETSLKALVDNTSLLMETPIAEPPKIIGKNTKDSIQSGIVLGQAYMVSEFARRIENELGYKINRILTGGFANVIRDQIVCFSYEENLVLDGLFEIYCLNAGEKNEKE